MFKRQYLVLPVFFTAVFGLSANAFAQSSPAPAPLSSQAAAPAGAQAPAMKDATAPHRHHRGAMQRALATLNLRADQKTQIAGFMKAYRASHGSANPMTRRQLAAQIQGVLTPEQRTQFQTAMQHSRQGVPAAAGPAPSATP